MIFHIFSLIFKIAILIATLTTAQQDIGRETLGANNGWGAATTGTTGGSSALPGDIYNITNRLEFVTALNRSGDNPKILYIRGTINFNVDDANNPIGLDEYSDPIYNFTVFLADYHPDTWGRDRVPSGPQESARQRSRTRQNERVLISIPSNTTIVGVADSAKIMQANLVLSKDNVIIRNIEFQDAFDYFPKWDPTDGSLGNWNSIYDLISIKGGTHVWIDHCTFSDGENIDANFPSYYNRKYQHHDGLLDVNDAANYITISYNHFKNHDKTMLIGGSDGATGDDGKLKVTLHHNYFQNLMQRVPRLRFGEVHIYNNYYEGSTSTGDYRYSYAWGIGFSSKIFADNNVLEIPALETSKVGSLANGNALFDRGTVLNGVGVNVSASLGLSGNVGWTPVLHEFIDTVDIVKAGVVAGAGAGKL